MKDFKFFSDYNNLNNSRQYDSEGFEFIGVTPLMYNPHSFSPVKHMLFRCIETGGTVRGEQINEEHPMWDYNN